MGGGQTPGKRGAGGGSPGVTLEAPRVTLATPHRRAISFRSMLPRSSRGSGPGAAPVTRIGVAVEQARDALRVLDSL
jgi:hypothetical protein